MISQFSHQLQTLSQKNTVPISLDAGVATSMTSHCWPTFSACSRLDYYKCLRSSMTYMYVVCQKYSVISILMRRAEVAPCKRD